MILDLATNIPSIVAKLTSHANFNMKKTISKWGWDGSPRAVVPSQSMLESTLPILGTCQHVHDSPTEYGIAVFVFNDAGKDGGKSSTKNGVKDARDPLENGGKAGDSASGMNGGGTKVVGSRQLPMYYVSPKVAKSRGRGLQEGWYIVPEVGKKFCLRATNLSSMSAKETKAAGV